MVTHFYSFFGHTLLDKTSKAEHEITDISNSNIRCNLYFQCYKIFLQLLIKTLSLFIKCMYYTLDTNTEDPHTLFKARTGTNP